MHTRQGLQRQHNATKRHSLIPISRAEKDLSLNHSTIASQKSHHDMRDENIRTMLSAMNVVVVNKRTRRSANSRDPKPPISSSQTKKEKTQTRIDKRDTPQDNVRPSASRPCTMCAP